MCTGAKREAIAEDVRAAEKAKVKQPELVAVGASKETEPTHSSGACCDPVCGPSTCGQ